MKDTELKHIEINLGKICNNRCIFCMTYDNEKMSFVAPERVKKEIANFARQGYNSLGFLGGEPTIYPGILNIIAYTIKKGFKNIHIVSNGRRFADEKFVRELIHAGVTRFSVSIHSHTPEIEDGLTQVRGGFEQKIKGLCNLVKLKGEGAIKENIAVNIVINKKNYKNLTSTIAFFKNMGLNEFRLNFIRPEGRAFSHFDELVPSYSNFAECIEPILNIAEKKGISLTMGDVPFCILKEVSYPLTFMGELRDYLNLVVSFNDSDKDGVPLKETFLWKERRKNELKVKGKRCKECKYDDICEGIWRNYAEKKGFKEFKPIKK